VHIPDAVDVELMHPLSQELARASLQIPQDAKVILVYGVTENQRKGLRYTLDALKRLELEPKPWLLSFGDPGALQSLQDRYPVRSLGYLHSTVLQNLAYAAADVFVLPTLADNLPLTLLDSLACGTPVVAFDVGGVSDAVRHMQTGYLARLRDVDDLAQGIQQMIMLPPDQKARMREQCRAVAVQEFSLDLYVSRYAELYQAMTEQHKIVSSSK